MKRHLFFCLAFLIPLLAYGQIETKSSFLGNNMRMWVGGGFAFSTTGKRLEKGLSENGFGDRSSSSVFGITANKGYPISNRFFFAAALIIERKWSDHNWLGLGAGLGPLISATGFDRTGSSNLIFIQSTLGKTVVLKHSSWYLSPVFSHDVPKTNFGIFGGPKIDFHTLKTNWDKSEVITSRQTKLGAIIGARVNLADRLKWILAFHWSPKVKYAASTYFQQEGSKTIPFSLSEISAGTSNVQLGLAYRF